MRKPKVGDIVEGFDGTTWEAVRVLRVDYWNTHGTDAWVFTEMVRDRRSKVSFDRSALRPLTSRPA